MSETEGHSRLSWENILPRHHQGRHELPPQEPDQKQVTTLHSLITRSWCIPVIYNDRLALIEAFQNASAPFPKMDALNYHKLDNYYQVTLSEPNTSSIPQKDPLVGHEGEYSGTQIGVLHTHKNNPYKIMRIRRFVDENDFKYGSTSSVGLYIAQPIKGGEVTYFAVAKRPGGDGRLQIIENLDEQLTNALKQDVQRAIKVMKKNKTIKFRS